MRAEIVSALIFEVFFLASSFIVDNINIVSFKLQQSLPFSDIDFTNLPDPQFLALTVAILLGLHAGLLRILIHLFLRRPEQLPPAEKIEKAEKSTSTTSEEGPEPEIPTVNMHPWAEGLLDVASVALFAVLLAALFAVGATRVPQIAWISRGLAKAEFPLVGKKVLHDDLTLWDHFKVYLWSVLMFVQYGYIKIVMDRGLSSFFEKK